MEPRLLFDVAKLIECGLKGDRDKVAAYAEQLAARLEKDGDTKASDRFRQILKERPARTATVARAEINQIVPVDPESRLPVADVEQIKDDVFLTLTEPDEELVSRFLKHYRNIDCLSQHGVGITPTLLVYGPPGCGKTQLARFIASKLGLPLLTARADALISSYLGSTSKNIRAMFAHVEARPCVLFLDEIDAIAKMRDDTHELGELKRVVITLLQNIDALSKEHVIIAATNHAHLLDPAVWRRFAYKLELFDPIESQRTSLLRQFLGTFADDRLLSILTNITNGMNGSQIRAVAEEAIRDTLLETPSASRVSLRTATKITLEQIAHRPVSDIDEQIKLIRQVSGSKLSTEVIGEMIGTSQATAWRHDKKLEKADEEGTNQDRRAG